MNVGGASLLYCGKRDQFAAPVGGTPARQTAPAALSTSAIARSNPITIRSAMLKPLMSPPPACPLIRRDTTPSRVMTKLLKTTGCEARRGIRRSPYRRANFARRGSAVPRDTLNSGSSGASETGEDHERAIINSRETAVADHNTSWIEQACPILSPQPRRRQEYRALLLLPPGRVLGVGGEPPTPFQWHPGQGAALMRHPLALLITWR
jgi:hypothetical protein